MSKLISTISGKKTTNLHQKYSKIEPNKDYITNEWQHSSNKIILIGTSTGGPGALQTVLTKLPVTIPAPIVIVQHMPTGFTKSLANRLNMLSDIHIKEAEDGEILKNGYAYIAPGGFYLKIKQVGNKIVVQLDETDNSSIHCPSVDLLFTSASELKDYDKIVVIMTGMGSDGTKGLITLKTNSQVKAIAQAEESCIVYGMPKAAIATNLIDDIVNVEYIAETILKYL